MAHLIDITTANPSYKLLPEDIENYYAEAIGEDERKKIRFLNKKTDIQQRYSCLPDFLNNKEKTLFDSPKSEPSVDERMSIYKKEAPVLAKKALKQLLEKNIITASDCTHLITVSCTGLTAPGIEHDLSVEFGLQKAEKLPINFAGCYAALKALKHAQIISKADPKACILIVSVELSTLHFLPSSEKETILSNLLFADGAAAALVCGGDHQVSKKHASLTIDGIGTATIPNTAELMSWDISQTAFRMYLDKRVVDNIQLHILDALQPLLENSSIQDIDRWAIHPGGVRIIQAVQHTLGLTNEQVEDSFHVLRNYGNMSSPTILFILKAILEKTKDTQGERVFACAFGPGLTVEMAHFVSNRPHQDIDQSLKESHAIAV